MDKLKLGLMHPGAMGSSIAAALSSKYQTGWLSEGRSNETRRRANEAGLKEFVTLDAFLDQTDILFSICPPSEAVKLAQECIGAGFKGTYVDANAVSPATANEIAQLCHRAGISYVDGGIIGPPARQAGTTRLYLSGEKAQEIAQLFLGSVVEATTLDGGISSASSLKMAYAAWTKGSSALLLNVRALAKSLGVEEALLSEWALSLPDLTARSESAALSTAAKAWRFAGEMNEIAATFADSGLPAGFHKGAEEVYQRMGQFKDAKEISTNDVLKALLEPEIKGS